MKLKPFVGMVDLRKQQPYIVASSCRTMPLIDSSSSGQLSQESHFRLFSVLLQGPTRIQHIRSLGFNGLKSCIHMEAILRFWLEMISDDKTQQKR